MKHSALVEEVNGIPFCQLPFQLFQVIRQSQSRFIPDVHVFFYQISTKKFLLKFIKKNIEALIDKYYLQRTDQNDEYEYIS